MKVELGERIIIDDIEMTCFEIHTNFNGVTYMFEYFQCGELKELRFAPGELDALGARKMEKV
jgi:hypothetical protein